MVRETFSTGTAEKHQGRGSLPDWQACHANGWHASEIINLAHCNARRMRRRRPVYCAPCAPTVQEPGRHGTSCRGKLIARCEGWWRRGRNQPGILQDCCSVSQTSSCCRLNRRMCICLRKLLSALVMLLPHIRLLQSFGLQAHEAAAALMNNVVAPAFESTRAVTQLSVLRHACTCACTSSSKAGG